MNSILASILLAGAAVASPGAEAEVAPVPALPENATLQQRYDWAVNAADNDQCVEAVAQFEQLGTRPATRKTPLVRDAIAVSKGRCLIRLGRKDEGEAAIRAGLPTLVAQKSGNFTDDIFMAHMALAGVAMSRLDYAIAEQDLRAALALAEGQTRARPLVDLARVTAFNGGPEPLAYAQEAVGLLRARPDAASKQGKEQIALAMAIHARILLNQDRVREAYGELQKSVALLGGLTLAVTLSDISARSDLAIAAILNNRPDMARQYLAYTGAGRMKDAPFASAAVMDTPDCGAAEGLDKDDMAIIEFSIGEDGSVGTVRPIYTTRGREVALAFARAVQGWSWSPEAAGQIPPFFKLLTRVELRCSGRGGDRADIRTPVADFFTAWVGMPPELARGDVRALPAARALAAGPDVREQIAGLAWIGTTTFAPREERAASLDKASQLAETLGAPAPVTTFLALSRDRVTTTPFDATAMRALLARPDIAADPLSAATLRLTLARPAWRYAVPADAPALLDAVADDARLPENDPLKVAALLEKASLAARRGDLQTAQASFAKTGLTEQQCAIIGAPPVMKKSGASSADFPQEAMNWGFEGWVRTEYDIGADGRTRGQRAVIAYPPFVFNHAAIGIARDFRYDTSYRPETGLGCAANQQTINFLLRR